MKKIAFIANSCWYIYNFRLSLLKELSATDNRVIIIAPKDNYTKILIDLGYEVYSWKLQRSSLNPFKEINSILNLMDILESKSPDLIHNFTIKSCLYGTIAAKFRKISVVVNSITGLGPLFINNSLKIKLIRLILSPIYKFVFNYKNAYTIFQNKYDQKFFLDFCIIKNLKKSFLIEGSGVDIELFKPIKDTNSGFNNPLKLLFPSRLIREKGIIEVLDAHKSLIKKGENIHLLIAGEIDKGNRSTLLNEEKKSLITNKNIKILGHRSDMKNIYSQSDIVILPSWREGLSRSLIEAGAMEKPIITCDVPGCREIIEHGINGIIVPLKNAKAIELAIIFLIRNQNIAKQYGRKIRLKVKERFDIRIINQKTINVYKKTLY
tara:strand:- start:22699 stop:23835 length:1137 start_codon:yes stop_codon:yes gene_type:complete